MYGFLLRLTYLTLQQPQCIHYTALQVSSYPSHVCSTNREVLGPMVGADNKPIIGGEHESYDTTLALPCGARGSLVLKATTASDETWGLDPLWRWNKVTLTIDAACAGPACK